MPGRLKCYGSIGSILRILAVLLQLAVAESQIPHILPLLYESTSLRVRATWESRKPITERKNHFLASYVKGRERMG